MLNTNILTTPINNNTTTEHIQQTSLPTILLHADIQKAEKNLPIAVCKAHGFRNAAASMLCILI
jgi:hypothetical protein